MAEPEGGGRLPDFLIIGAIKCGTTSLFQWLAQHPGVSVSVKEPHYFSNDESWARGVEWYSSLFSGAAPGAITGEASASYTAYRRCAVAAERACELVPRARLIYLVREPVERMRSHYRHAVLRGHESRLFDDVVRDPTARFVTSSLYHSCVAPYIERFGREQLLVLRLEDMAGDGGPAWEAVLDHLGLEQAPWPGGVHNRTSGKMTATPAARALFARGITTTPGWTPSWARRAGRRLLLRNIDHDPRLLSADNPVPDEVRARLYEDSERLAQVLGLPALWLDRDRT
jgi:hypothetical protein